MLFRTLLFMALSLSLSYTAMAQQPRLQNPNDSISADKASPGSEQSPLGSPMEEMKARREVEYLEKEYKENLERAREAAQLGSELREIYRTQKSLTRTDLKKLDRLEKLTRRIRSEAGGSDDEVTLEEVPYHLESALDRLVEISVELRKMVEKTPRQVVSASLIERTNQLLEVVRYVRTFTR
ncbi:MAG TPA: hypothetical protein VD966_10215 [Pyrinomonadaceae bacterium]|nr:hypothetical protein [Pyrinomonadaceae bacterium]